ncbi:MAG TPA: AAA family ATPase [Polyangia bacterium]|nr:AAA family ATPase [Polyangia bacterium]
MEPAARDELVGSFEIRTTHASKVFLDAHDVWKIKRPVDLGFLDFRDPEARRRFCEEEVRLNRRLAPDVYLGVAPVRRDARGLTLEGSGAVVDWAVHMRRLSDDDSAASLVRRGRLGADALEALAARLAAFHRAARETPDLGGEASVRALVEENLAQTERFVGELVGRATFDDVAAAQRAWLAANGATLAARVAEGRSREGHGDLRLEHVYFLSGDGPTVIDCVEFSERFRCGDVAGDVAFLAMELDAERRPDLAAGFVARYAEASGDLGLYAVLDFYLGYRAAVRGKVAAFAARDDAMSAEARAAKADEARRRFALARSYTAGPLDRPFVVAVGGPPGSGKSTLAAAVGRALAAPVVSSDVTRKALAGVAATTRAPAALYTDERRAEVYDEVLRRAEVVARAGRGVVLDATFSSPRWREAAASAARACGASFVLVEVGAAAPAILRARLAERRAGGRSASDATEAELDELLRRYESTNPAEGLSVVRVDGARSAADVVGEALDGLRRGGVVPAGERRRS